MLARPDLRQGAAVLAALVVAAAFFGAARWLGRAPEAAIWGGTVWVFLLATIVALPVAAAARRPGVARGARPGSGAWDVPVLAVAVWVCTLPVVLLIVGPLLGLRAALLTALVLLGAMTVVCWAVCMSSVSRERASASREQGR